MDEGGQRHWSATQAPAPISRQAPPALHLQLGIGPGDERHLVAVLGIGGLLRAGQGFRFVLGAQEGSEESRGVPGVPQGGSEPPGGAGGVAIVMEIEVAFRRARETGEGIDGAGGQGANASALRSATGVSHPGCAEPPYMGQENFSGVPRQTRGFIAADGLGALEGPGAAAFAMRWAGPRPTQPLRGAGQPWFR